VTRLDALSRPPRRRRGTPRIGRRPKNLLAFLRRIYVRWSEDRVPKLAAALAYYTSFSIAPILLIAIAVAGLVFGPDAARGAVSREISGLVGPRIGEGVETLLKLAWQPKAGLWATLLGALALLFGASGVFGELQDSLNIIWKVRRSRTAGWWVTLRHRFLSLGMVLVIGFLLLVSLVLSAGLEALADLLSGWAGKGFLIQMLNQAISLIIIAVLFAALFKVLPDAGTGWKDVTAGALLTSVLFTLGKYLIGLYLGRSRVGSAYGAAGSFVLLLLWIYYSSQIFYLGAEFTKAWADAHRRPTKPKKGAVPSPGVAASAPART
jgi:membrane protein